MRVIKVGELRHDENVIILTTCILIFITYDLQYQNWSSLGVGVIDQEIAFKQVWTKSSYAKLVLRINIWTDVHFQAPVFYFSVYLCFSSKIQLLVYLHYGDLRKILKTSVDWPCIFVRWYIFYYLSILYGR